MTTVNKRPAADGSGSASKALRRCIRRTGEAHVGPLA
jgi:hypothetical protein